MDWFEFVYIDCEGIVWGVCFEGFDCGFSG